VGACFVGSCDAVHGGHLVAAESAGEALDARVRFLPARVQPFKQAERGATPEQRAAMLDLAVAGNPRLAVERIELTLPAPSYTVRTLQALAEREPGNRFTLLLGADAAGELAAWYRVDALHRHEERLKELSDAELQGQTPKLRGLVAERTGALAAEVERLKQEKHDCPDADQRVELSQKLSQAEAAYVKALQGALSEVLPEAFATVREAW